MTQKEDLGVAYEQGIAVFAVSDYEWFAGASANAVLQFAAEQWGYKDIASAIADDACEPDALSPCDLDRNTVNVHPDAEDGAKDVVTYREALRRMIAEGQSFPAWFCGHD